MIIGITGGIGSGKSRIARELVKRGYTVYDCDREAKRIIVENKEVQAAIIELLGKEAFVDGKYNTVFVAQKVFENPALLQGLNGIVHPAVINDIVRRQPDFIESAILLEAGLEKICDKIVWVDAPEEIRIARTIHRDYHDELTQEHIDKVRARMRAQQKTSVHAEALQRPLLNIFNDGTLVLSDIVDLISHFASR